MTYTMVEQEQIQEQVFRSLLAGGYVAAEMKGAPERELTSGNLGLRALITGKFRGISVSEEEMGILQQRINCCVARRIPIPFVIPMGGYKKWQLPSSPEAGWAEFFHLAFMKDLALKIRHFYEPGVTLTYLACDIAMYDLDVDHFPHEHLDDYHASFQRLVDYFDDLFKKKDIRFSLKKLSQVIDRDCFLERFREGFAAVERFWTDSGNPLVISAAEARARRNYYYEKDPPSEDAVRLSAQKAWVFLKTFFELPIIDTKTQIPVVFRKSEKNCLPLRSFYGEGIQFWVSEGVLRKERDVFTPRLLSFASLKRYREDSVLSVGGYAFLGRNFSEIKVISGIRHG